MSLNTTIVSNALVVGKGQISSHVPKLFSLLHDNFIFCDRDTLFDFGYSSTEPKAVFLAVSDNSILEVYRSLKSKFSEKAHFYHLSGALSFAGIIGLHPLMTFSQDAKILDYECIPIYTDSEDFYYQHKKKLKNIRYIPANLKTKYHCMAVLLGNFSQLYLQTVKKNFPLDLVFKDYEILVKASIDSVFKDNSESRLTGPMIRRDNLSILKHKQTLENQNPVLLKIYEQMENLFEQELFTREN